MGRTASVACPECGVSNDVVIFEGTFEDNARRTAFSFACRVCGAALPEELSDGPAPAAAAESFELDASPSGSQSQKRPRRS